MHDDYADDPLIPRDIDDIHPMTAAAILSAALSYARGCACHRCAHRFAFEVRMLLTPVPDDRRIRYELT